MVSGTRIIGLAKLHRKLKKLPDVARDTIRAALEESAREIVRMAQRLVPVDKGDLVRSIGWTWGKPPKGAMILGKVTASKLAADLTITIYSGNSEEYYARFVEFGTKNMSAQPYFYPSYRANRKRVRSRISRAINRAAKKVAAQ